MVSIVSLISYLLFSRVCFSPRSCLTSNDGFQEDKRHLGDLISSYTGTAKGDYN